MSSHAAIKQITKSTFTPSLLRELKSHIDGCDFISLSSIKTASATSYSPWRRRILPFDTAETAYLKAKLAAESFQILNVSICPFRVHGSKVVAFPNGTTDVKNFGPYQSLLFGTGVVEPVSQ